MVTNGTENPPEPLDPARVGEASVSVPFELWVTGRLTAGFPGRAVGEQP